MAETAGRSPRKAKGQGAERREEILAAASRLFGEFGVYAVSTRQIAEAVGISQPTLYAYFASKDEIKAALTNLAFQKLAASMAEAAKGEARTARDLADMLRPYIEFGLKDPDAYRIAFMIEGPLPHMEGLEGEARECYGMLSAKIADLHAKGLTVDLDPVMLPQIIWAQMHGLVSLLIARPVFPWADRETLIDAHLMQIARATMRG